MPGSTEPVRRLTHFKAKPRNVVGKRRSVASMPGQPQFADLVLVKELDRASPRLALAAAQGSLLRDARIEWVRLAPTKVMLARLDLRQVVVRRLSSAGTTIGARPLERVSLGFGHVRFAVVELDVVRGVPRFQHTMEWDLGQGRGDVTTAPWSGVGGEPDPSRILDRNLLVNPGAEASAGATDLLTVAPPDGWQTNSA